MNMITDKKIKKVIWTALVIIAVLFLLLGIANEAKAACQCNCINGRMQSLCSSSLDVPAMCVGVCPIAPPSIKPIKVPRIPPIGASFCNQEQVLRNGQYVWEEVCW